MRINTLEYLALVFILILLTSFVWPMLIIFILFFILLIPIPIITLT